MIYKNKGDNMFVHILSWIHNITTMLFGIYISAFFLGVKQNKNNITKLSRRNILSDCHVHFRRTGSKQYVSVFDTCTIIHIFIFLLQISAAVMYDFNLLCIPMLPDKQLVRTVYHEHNKI